MIYSANPVLTEDLCVITCVKCTFDERPNIFIRDNPIFSSKRMLHKDYYCKGSVGKREKSVVFSLKVFDAKAN
jgi:hypothetical protein